MQCLSVLVVAAAAAAVHSQSLCASDADCGRDSACDLRRSGRCRCLPGFTAWLDGCVPRRQLGEPCSVSPQCRGADEHAVCQPERRVCDCDRGFLRRGARCQFQFAVPTSRRPAAADGELARILGLPTEQQRRRQREAHRSAFERGLLVAGVLVGLTAAVFTLSCLVSRRMRREEEQAAELPLKYRVPPPPPPPPYSVSTAGAVSLPHGDMAAAVCPPQPAQQE